MSRAVLLIVTAFLEVGTGILLLFVPAVPLDLLLGIGESSRETSLIARLAGAALLAIGTACWFAWNGELRDGQFGLLIGLLIYDGGCGGVARLCEYRPGNGGDSALACRPGPYRTWRVVR